MKLKERSVLTVLRQQPQKVDGDFYCSNNQLTSLEGCPQEVGGHFSCSGNELTGLVGCPQKVGGDFWCSGNELTGLVGCPQKVGGTFYCHSNQLTTLKGGPQEVDGNFYCSFNELTNLKDIHKQIKFIGGQANFLGNPIKSHVVGLLLINGLKHVYLDNEEVMNILNKHVKADKDVLACIEELENAGFPEFAKI